MWFVINMVVWFVAGRWLILFMRSQVEDATGEAHAHAHANANAHAHSHPHPHPHPESKCACAGILSYKFVLNKKVLMLPCDCAEGELFFFFSLALSHSLHPWAAGGS